MKEINSGNEDIVKKKTMDKT